MKERTEDDLGTECMHDTDKHGTESKRECSGAGYIVEWRI